MTLDETGGDYGVVLTQIAREEGKRDRAEDLEQAMTGAWEQADARGFGGVDTEITVPKALKNVTGSNLLATQQLTGKFQAELQTLKKNTAEAVGSAFYDAVNAQTKASYLEQVGQAKQDAYETWRQEMSQYREDVAQYKTAMARWQQEQAESRQQQRGLISMITGGIQTAAGIGLSFFNPAAGVPLAASGVTSLTSGGMRY
jgi:hypothetical protein